MIVRLGDEKVIEQARRERQGLRQRLWRIKNLELRRIYWREWRKKNAERERERKRLWREKNKDHIRAYMKRRWELNPAFREYRAQKNREYRARRKARLQ
jgi:hypothetical protein